MVLAGILGWVSLYLLSSLPLWVRIQEWYWRFSTGTKKQTSTQDLVEEYVSEIQETANQVREDTAVSGEDEA